MEHVVPCFLQVHLMVPQSPWQLHQMMRRTSSGAGNKSEVNGKLAFLHSNQPWVLSMPVCAEFNKAMQELESTTGEQNKDTTKSDWKDTHIISRE